MKNKVKLTLINANLFEKHAIYNGNTHGSCQEFRF